jgi:hypothetical protein
MNAEYSSTPPETLVEQIKLSSLFRRRAVLTNENDQWRLLCCTVEGFRSGEMSEPARSRKYRHAVLVEDLLTAEECLSFVASLQYGHASFGDILLRRHQNPQWTTVPVAVNNDSMACAGYVIGLRFGQDLNQIPLGTLLAPDQPYYPNVYEAARDWLPFPVYHGENDGRHGQVFFLLPETRAFITGAVFSEQETLSITVDGTDIDRLSLLIKGAYWIGKSIHHFENEVRESKAVLVVPADADRLEYYLLDRTGVIYGFHKEDRYSQFRSNGNVLGSVKHKLDQVRDAANKGEGMRIEFKPFVDLESKRKPDSKKTKLDEIVRTVAAFANTAGGHIYLGIEDDCSITGIDNKLNEWAKSAIDESVINRYLGALRSEITGRLNEEVTLELSYARIDGVLVAIIEVPLALRKPVSIRQDNHLYARRGANNRQVPPDQWESILAPSHMGGLNFNG